MRGIVRYSYPSLDWHIFISGSEQEDLPILVLSVHSPPPGHPKSTDPRTSLIAIIPRSFKFSPWPPDFVIQFPASSCITIIVITAARPGRHKELRNRKSPTFGALIVLLHSNCAAFEQTLMHCNEKHRCQWCSALGRW